MKKFTRIKMIKIIVVISSEIYLNTVVVCGTRTDVQGNYLITHKKKKIFNSKLGGFIKTK